METVSFYTTSASDLRVVFSEIKHQYPGGRVDLYEPVQFRKNWAHLNNTTEDEKKIIDLMRNSPGFEGNDVPGTKTFKEQDKSVTDTMRLLSGQRAEMPTEGLTDDMKAKLDFLSDKADELKAPEVPKTKEMMREVISYFNVVGVLVPIKGAKMRTIKARIVRLLEVLEEQKIIEPEGDG